MHKKFNFLDKSQTMLTTLPTKYSLPATNGIKLYYNVCFSMHELNFYFGGYFKGVRYMSPL